MKHAYLWLLLGLSLIGFNGKLKAQATLGLYTTSVSSNTPALGDLLYVYTELRNTSATDTFTGIINFDLANHAGVINNVSIVGKPNYNGTSITIAPHSYMSALFTVNLQPSYFSVGPEIIIVWPISAVATVDSARAPINILAPLGIANIADENMAAFVFNEQLFIKNLNTKNQLEQLRIFNIVGSTVILQPLNDAENTIPLNTLPAGIYVAEITNAAGERKAIKFVK